MMSNAAPSCLSCAIVSGITNTLGGPVLETDRFHVHQDARHAIPGFMIVATKRHLSAFDELDESEATEFALIVRRVRRAQRDVLGTRHVHILVSEDTRHHFHAWMLPKHPWMDAYGQGAEAMRGALLHSASHPATPAERQATVEACTRIRDVLAKPSHE
ncbi:hypothetical protein KCV01_g13553, partial [Aureobasidium melanogenum]